MPLPDGPAATPTESPKATEFNATDYLVDRQLRDGNGDRTAVSTPERDLSYAQLAAEIRTVAGGLLRLGVRAEDRVLMCMLDGVELFTAILAAMHVGAVAVPCSTMLTGGELGKLVVDSRARVVLGSGALGEQVRTAVATADEVEHVVLTEPATVDGAASSVTWRSWDSAFSGAEPVPAYATWPDSPCLWLYTSGTTGTPKAAMHRHDDIRLVAETYAREVLGITATDRCLSVAKLFFAYGIGNSMFFPLSVGASVVLEPSRPTPALIADLAARKRPTLLFGVPSFWGPLLASDVPDDAFASVRLGASAGETLPARLFHGMVQRFGVEVLDGIGSTEMLHIFISNRAGAVHPGSSGTPVPGYTVEIRDEQGTPITDAGVPGELYVRGASAAFGYWCRTETSRAVFLGEWTRTGDTYVRNDDGTYSCLGRYNDMLKAGGIWVTPSEVEDRLLEHPDVAEAVVVGIPDTDELDKPVACIVGKPGHEVDADTLIQWCRDGLASFKRPRAVVAFTEIPKTATGKIRRNILREQVGAQLSPEAETPPKADPMTTR